MAAVSEPTPGSVDASAVSGGVGEHSGASHRCCCSGVPTSTTGRAKNPPDVTRFPIPAQPQFSSSWTMQPVRTSATPPPPTSSGSMNDVSPTSAARCTTSTGQCVSRSSTSAATGRISARANSAASAWISRCSSVRSAVGEAACGHAGKRNGAGSAGLRG